MQEALGMVETKGLVAMIEAADAMVKAANVTLDADRLRKDRRGFCDRNRAWGCCRREGCDGRRCGSCASRW